MSNQSPGNIRDEPTVLVIGSGGLTQRLAEALGAEGADVECARADVAVSACQAAAPDLVVLIGDAASNGGRRLLSDLAADATASLAPVVIVGPRSSTAGRSFRHGPIATLPATAPVAELASQLHSLASELPERDGNSKGPVAAETLDNLVMTLADDMRTGVLSVKRGERDEPEARTAMRSGRPVSESPEEFIERAKPVVGSEQPATYEFRERGAHRMHSLAPSGSSDPKSLGALKRRRVMIVDSDPRRAERLSRALRSHGAIVITAASTGDLERAQALDPEVLIIDPRDLEGPCAAIIEAAHEDIRLRWTSILVAKHEDLWPNGGDEPDVGRLASNIDKLMLPARQLRRRLQFQPDADTRLELTGPGQLLRILADSGKTLRVHVRHPRTLVHIDISEGAIWGARATCKEGQTRTVTGASALSAMLVIGSARVHIQGRARPELRELKSPVDLALSLAQGEPPPIRPSLAPEKSPEPAPPAAPAPAPPAAPAPAPSAAAVPAPSGRSAAAAPHDSVQCAPEAAGGPKKKPAKGAPHSPHRTPRAEATVAAGRAGDAATDELSEIVADPARSRPVRPGRVRYPARTSTQHAESLGASESASAPHANSATGAAPNKVPKRTLLGMPATTEQLQAHAQRPSVERPSAERPPPSAQRVTPSVKGAWQAPPAPAAREAEPPQVAPPTPPARAAPEPAVPPPPAPEAPQPLDLAHTIPSTSAEQLFGPQGIPNGEPTYQDVPLDGRRDPIEPIEELRLTDPNTFIDDDGPAWDDDSPETKTPIAWMTDRVRQMAPAGRLRIGRYMSSAAAWVRGQAQRLKPDPRPGLQEPRQLPGGELSEGRHALPSLQARPAPLARAGAALSARLGALRVPAVPRPVLWAAVGAGSMAVIMFIAMSLSMGPADPEGVSAPEAALPAQDDRKTAAAAEPAAERTGGAPQAATPDEPGDPPSAPSDKSQEQLAAADEAEFVEDLDAVDDDEEGLTDEEAEAEALAEEEEEAGALARQEAEADTEGGGHGVSESKQARLRRIRRANALIKRGHSLRRRGRLGMAEASYLKALRAWPRYPWAMASLVRVHLQRKHGREALRWAKKLVRRQPNRSNNQLLLGDAYAMVGKRAAARHHWRKSARYGNKVARRRLRRR